MTKNTQLRADILQAVKELGDEPPVFASTPKVHTRVHFNRARRRQKTPSVGTVREYLRALNEEGLIDGCGAFRAPNWCLAEREG